ncbi:hypothetical protein jhhlp_006933 [Lomentospora prolificans]|uniref:Uncharacterized protein n=1 Tax=Lomentospora prolificans TaxID=41688 RepID=A0A2N3N358_9PEZI|nr:hypothetical protein jhhlp_006933 [Lomentospora prolificans]
MSARSHKRARLQSDTDRDAAHAIFQKHFESHFEPLPQLETPVSTPHDIARESHESNEEDEWSGISDDEGDTIEVVDHASNLDSSFQSMGKREAKAYLSSRPPSDLTSPKHSNSIGKSGRATDTSSLPEDSRTLLAQDLALHRLITESHLLDPSSKLHSKPFSQGRIRMHSTDLRITSLAPAGTKSILTQATMPMAMRKGIKAAKKGREDQRRREAWENGIVLERKGGQGSVTAGKRKRSNPRVDLPSVGKLRGAELRLSERDLRSMGASSTERSRGPRGHTTDRRR